MSRVRRCTLQVLTVFILATLTSEGLRSQSGSTLNGHTVRLDSSGKLLAWGAVQNDAFDQVLGLSTDYLLNRVPTGPNGLKLYYSYSYAYPGNPVQPANWPHNPAGLFAMLTDSGLAYYAYSGNPAIMTLVRDVLTYHLDHGMTPPTWHWPNVPFASSDPGALNYQGARWGDDEGIGDGFGVIQPDKVGELGVAFLRYYEHSGATRFRDAGIQAADALASHVRVGSASQSPWPFRVYAETNAVREQYGANVIAPIRLFDELIRLNLGNVDAYRAARQTAWNWLMTHPIRNNVWSKYFEDVGIDSDLSNTNQLVAGETARYLMQHPEFDPDWEVHVRGIIAWIESAFASTAFGATRIAEQQVFFHAMGSHTSRYASLNAQLYELTGDLVAREKAYRSFNWATYMCGPTGVVIDGPTVNNVWWTDGYGDYIKHFVAGLGSVPEWAPQNRAHLLRSTSVVRSIQYDADEITYQTFDRSAQEVLRLNFVPQGVTADSLALPNRTDLTQEGWTYDATTGVLRIRHDSATQLRISSVPPLDNLLPVINLDSPAPGTYSTPTLVLAATANDPDGTISRVEFFQNGVSLASSTTAPYGFTWTSVPSGTYQLSARATDNRGGTATSGTVQVTVSGPVPPSSPTNLVATLSGGSVSLTWSPPDGPGVSGYKVYRSTTTNFLPAPANLVGQPASPAFIDPGLPAGTYYYRVVAVDAIDTASASSNEATATIAGVSGLAVDKVVFSDGTGTRTTPSFSTAFAGEVLLAFVASDGSPGSVQTITVAGAGLNWTLVRRVNTQRGASEIWQATAANPLANVAVTATPALAGYHQSLTVVTFAGASGVGASAVASAPTGAPAVSLTTTRAGSLVYGVGNDWDRAIARVPVAGQVLVHQWVDTSVGDTFWVQAVSAAIVNAGTLVQLRASAPTTDRWNFAAVEITPATAPLPPVTVPDVTGLSQSTARSLIEGAGLVVGSVTSQPSTTVSVGYVISQTPSPATQVAQGSTVAFVTSSGAQLVSVPNVVGQPLATAQTLITGAGLAVGTIISQSSATVPIGSVVSQNPPSGSQATAGSAVDFVVSSGPQLVAVPNVVGQSQAAAAALITAAGLVTGPVTNQPSSTVALGTVISQTPTPGTQVGPGTGVALIVSSGPQLVPTPNVVGQTQTAAASLITSAGLAMGTVTSQPSTTVGPGNVISQSPPASTLVAPGSVVNLTVSSGAPPVVLAPTVDKVVFSDGTGTRTTGPFSTVFPGELLLAFVASDGPTNGGQSITVTGAGLSWTLVRRVTAQRGSSEIWRAMATNPLVNATVRATPTIGGYHQSLTVVTFDGASGVGASAVASASSGAPAVSLTTTKTNSLVYGVGNDWDRAVGRVPVGGQILVHQWIDTAVGDTFWVQATSTAITGAGTVVQLRSSAPTNDRWNFAAVEILAR